MSRYMTAALSQLLSLLMFIIYIFAEFWSIGYEKKVKKN